MRFLESVAAGELIVVGGKVECDENMHETLHFSQRRCSKITFGKRFFLLSIFVKIDFFCCV